MTNAFIDLIRGALLRIEETWQDLLLSILSRFLCDISTIVVIHLATASLILAHVVLHRSCSSIITSLALGALATKHVQLFKRVTTNGLLCLNLPLSNIPLSKPRLSSRLEVVDVWFTDKLLARKDHCIVWVLRC